MPLNVSTETNRTTRLMTVGFVCALFLLAFRPIEALRGTSSWRSLGLLTVRNG